MGGERGQGAEEAARRAQSLTHTQRHTRVCVCTLDSASARRGLGAGGEKPDFPSTLFLPPPPIHKPAIK